MSVNVLRVGVAWSVGCWGIQLCAAPHGRVYVARVRPIMVIGLDPSVASGLRLWVGSTVFQQTVVPTKARTVNVAMQPTSKVF